MMDLSGLTNLTSGNSDKVHSAASFEHFNLEKDQEISLLWVADAGSNDPKNGVAYASEVPLMTCVKQRFSLKKCLTEKHKPQLFILTEGQERKAMRNLSRPLKKNIKYR